MNYKKLSKIVDSASKDYAFLMVRYDMPQFIKDIQSQLTEEDLYVDPDGKEEYGLELESHVTLFPCLDNDISVNDTVPYLLAVPQLQATLINVSMFENEEYNVLKADVDSEALKSLNADLLKHFECHSEYKDHYHPHMTIAYVKKDSEHAKSFCKDIEPVVITPTDYYYSWKNDGKDQRILFTLH